MSDSPRMETTRNSSELTLRFRLATPRERAVWIRTRSLEVACSLTVCVPLLLGFWVFRLASMPVTWLFPTVIGVMSGFYGVRTVIQIIGVRRGETLWMPAETAPDTTLPKTALSLRIAGWVAWSVLALLNLVFLALTGFALWKMKAGSDGLLVAGLLVAITAVVSTVSFTAARSLRAASAHDNTSKENPAKSRNKVG